jgi:tetratricopeptide (TPR) repeat protein
VRLISVLVLAMAAAVAAGCGNSVMARGDRTAFNEGMEAFDMGQWQRAANSFTEYLRTAPAETRGEVYYMRGESLVRLHRRAEAQSDFRQALAAKPRQEVETYTYVAIGNLAYEEGRDQEAIEAYAKAVGNPPGKLPLDQVLLRLGVSLQRTGRFASADKYLDHVVSQYSATPAGIEAARRIHATAFTLQTGAYASPVTAQGEIDRLRSAGYAGRIVKAMRGTQPLNAVQVGRYRTYAEAAAAAVQLSRQGFTAMIVP